MPTFRAAPVHIRVCATSANLGPGFDSFGLALGLYDDVIARVADSGLTVDVAGEGEDRVDRAERNLVVKAMRQTFKALGGQPRGLEIVCANRIPHSRGLGSSAAAIVAGILAARALTVTSMSDDDVLALATRMEGHPDNVAAALRGGLTVSWTDAGAVGVADLPVAPGITAVAFVPTTTQNTERARALLPASVPHAVAAANAARAALLPAALGGRMELLMAATVDALHQPFRLASQQRGSDLLDKLRAAGHAAVLSGSGPTVLVLCADPDEAHDAAAMATRGWVAHVLPVDREGARLVS